MRRTVSILLLLVFWFSTVGYFHLFKILQADIRHDIKRMIKEQVPEHELTIIAFSPSEKIMWTKINREFRHEGRMYDVVRKSEKDGKVIYYCIDDKKESLLLSHVENLLRDHSRHDKCDAPHSVRTLLNLMPNLFFPGEEAVLIFDPGFLVLSPYFTMIPLDGFLSTLSPPPMNG